MRDFLGRNLVRNLVRKVPRPLLLHKVPAQGVPGDRVHLSGFPPPPCTRRVKMQTAIYIHTYVYIYIYMAVCI